MQNTTSRQSLVTTIALFWWLLAATSMAFAQINTAFTYQGRLTDTGTLASGAYDLQFALFDAASAGAQQGANVTLSNVSVTGGIFTVSLDFGSAPFATGAPRFLQIGVRPGGGSGTFTLLTPRQQLAPTPYALHSVNADQLGGVLASQYVTGPVVSGVNGLSGNVTLAAGANVTLTPSGNTLTIAATGGGGGTGNFIQNTTTPQANANFNISGNGTVGGDFNAALVSAPNISATNISATSISATSIAATTSVDAPSYNIGAQRILSNAGVGNLFAGVLSGANNTGSNNAFFGRSTGSSNTTGGENAFFGSNAGLSNAAGSFNAFFGFNAGGTTQGSFNTFIGRQAGFGTTSGAGNVFIGNDTGLTNSIGSSNTLIGSGANVGGGGLSFATAIGSLATASVSNSVTLGRANGADRVIMPGGMGGGLTLNGNTLFLRGNNDNNATIASTVNFVGFNSPGSFGWNGPSGAIMVLQNNGNLAIAGNYLQTSDARYKTNIQTYAGGLAAVMRLRGVTYHWKPELQKDARRQLGFIAQEVETVLPELVNTDEHGYKSVSYANAVPVLVEAIKEQQQQLAAQQRQLEELKAQVVALTAQLTQPKAAGQR